jgi:hypothetical protein
METEKDADMDGHGYSHRHVHGDEDGHIWDMGMDMRILPMHVRYCHIMILSFHVIANFTTKQDIRITGITLLGQTSHLGLTVL